METGLTWDEYFLVYPAKTTDNIPEIVHFESASRRDAENFRDNFEEYHDVSCVVLQYKDTFYVTYSE